MLQEFQKQKLLHLFDILDFNHNGILQKDDFISIAKNIDMFIITHANADLHSTLVNDINSLWTDIQQFFNNKSLLYLTRDQWVSYMGHKFDAKSLRETSRKIDKLVIWLTHIFDQSSDDKLSKLEFLTIFVSLRVPAKRAEDCFDIMDHDRDGYISEPEISRAARHYFLRDIDHEEGNGLFGLLGATHFVERKSHTRSR